MSAALQWQLRNNADDMSQALSSLRDWVKDSKQQDDALRGKDPKLAPSKEEEIEQIRKKIQALPNNPNTQKKVPPNKAGPTDFKTWDKYDADAQVKQLEKHDEEREKLRQDLLRLENAQRQARMREAALEAEGISEKFRQEGNSAFASAQYADAVEAYTSALEHTPRSATLYSNRSLALLKLRLNEEAEEDATVALSFEPDNVKAQLRRATARMALSLYDGALDDLERVLELEPKNGPARRQLVECRQLKNNAFVKKPPAKKLVLTQYDNDPGHANDSFVLAASSASLSRLVERASGDQTETKSDDDDTPLSSSIDVTTSATATSTLDIQAVHTCSMDSVQTAANRLARTDLGQPSSSTDVERAYRSLRRDEFAWASYVHSLEPSLIRKLFSRSLPAELLSPFIIAYFEVARGSLPNSAERAFQGLGALADSGRFEIAAMCLGRKDIAKLDAALGSIASSSCGILQSEIDDLRRRYV